MREVKFRFWNGQNMQEIHLLGLHWELEEDPPIYVDLPGEDRVPHYSDCQPMQFTGLKDKNGVEIYEGDIADTPIIDNKIQKLMTKKAKIVWYSAGWFLDIKGDALSSLNENRSVMIEVIGNIYENPELLK